MSHVTRVALVAGMLTLAAAPFAGCRQSVGMDEDFARSVKAWTTKPEFLSPLVDHLPASGEVPSPKAALGHHIGHRGVLHYSDQVFGYFRKLEVSSSRVKLETIGRTEEGRDILVAFVSSEGNIENLAAYGEHLLRLGDTRGLDEAGARGTIERAKPIYHITGGLHANETGAPEMLMELAYRLAVEESDLVRRIRDDVIVAITPVADPDGRDRVTDWYYRHNADVSDCRGRRPGPPYWSKYVLHDNNRDISCTTAAMGAHLAFHLKWRPTVMHDLHETLPYLYIYSGSKRPLAGPPSSGRPLAGGSS